MTDLEHRAREATFRLWQTLEAFRPSMRGTISIRPVPAFVNEADVVRQAIRLCNLRTAARQLGFGEPERSE